MIATAAAAQIVFRVRESLSLSRLLKKVQRKEAESWRASNCIARVTVMCVFEKWLLNKFFFLNAQV